jgi:putative DNA primase/helicase
MSAREIAHHLKGRKSGAGYIARCPAHNDRDPSLSLKDVDGKVLVKCHAGCEQRKVIAALIALGLWPERKCGEDNHDIQAVYSYTDEHGALLYQIVRKVGKRFLQRRPDGFGGWIWKKHPRQVLYRLPEVLGAPIVFLVEGEKDCETLRDYGFIATTNAGGADAPWLAAFSEVLRGREVILIPDNDAPGWKRCTTIARALLNVAARIVVFDLPPEVKDVTDWFQAGHSECELIALLEKVDALQR